MGINIFCDLSVYIILSNFVEYFDFNSGSIISNISFLDITFHLFLNNFLTILSKTIIYIFYF